MIDILIEYWPSCLAFVGSAALCVFGLRKVAAGLLDPLYVINLSVPLSSALLAALCTSGLVSWDRLGWFFMTQAAFFGAAGALLPRRSKEALRLGLQSAAAAVRRNEAVLLVLSALGVTAVLAAAGIALGASGDDRQEFARAFRPLVLLQSGLVWMTLLVLLSGHFTSRLCFLILSVLIALSLPFSGKAIVFPLIYWIGLRTFLRGGRLTARALLAGATAAIGGAALMGALSYSTGDGGALGLVLNRLWLSGDGYIYAYQGGALDQIRQAGGPSFIAYMLHPITSLFGIRAYDKPLGALIASAFVGDEVFTGPNPQVPLLLDYFFANDWFVAAAVAAALGVGVLGVRLLPYVLRHLQGRFLRLGVGALAFFAPAAGFLDTSQVLISAIGVVIAATFMTLLVAVLPTRSRAVIAQEAA